MAVNSDTKQLNPKQQAFLDHLFSDECRGNIRKAMAAAGYAKTTKQTEIFRGLVAERVAEIARNYLGINSLKAAIATTDIIDNPVAPGNREKLAAAQAILDRAGVVKREEVKHEIDKPILTVLMPAKAPVEYDD